jgi:hypothetical protein
LLNIFWRIGNVGLELFLIEDNDLGIISSGLMENNLKGQGNARYWRWGDSKEALAPNPAQKGKNNQAEESR